MKKHRLLLALAILLLILVVSSGTIAKGHNPPPPPVTGPMILNWNPAFAKSTGIVELQIFRDPGSAGPSAPFYVITNALVLAQGYIDLTPIYADEAASWIGHTVDYNRISPDGKSLIAMSYTWEPEGYGIPHTYQIAAILKKQAGKKCSYSYDFGDFKASGTMTCVERVTADPSGIVMPLNGDWVVITDLRDGMVDPTWYAAAGANEYQVTVQPVVPGLAPAWHSSIIYDMSAPGDYVALSDPDRMSLATMLSSPQLAFQDIMWRVDARNSGDTMPYWTVGDWSTFTLVFPPPGP